MAEVTEIAGVIMPSPKNSPAPKMPRVTRMNVRPIRLRWTSAVSAMIPPSPRLWARMMNPAYFERHHDHQRPEDQRGDPVDAGHMACAALRWAVKMNCSV